MKNSRINFIAKVGVFSAIAFALQFLGSILPFKIGFLEIEFSDLPAIILTFALGPMAGVLVELIKNILHLTISSTGFVGEFANFVINGSWVLAAGLIYKRKKTRNNAILSLALATVAFVVLSVFVNYYVMLPLYAPGLLKSEMLHIIIYTIVPFNTAKGAVLSVITILTYKKISGMLK